MFNLIFNLIVRSSPHRSILKESNVTLPQDFYVEKYKPLLILLVNLKTLDLTFTPGKLLPTWDHLKEFIETVRMKRAPLFLKFDPNCSKYAFLFILLTHS